MKKRLLTTALLAALGAAAAGCGKDDPNKNLKPVDPNAPKPSGAGAAGPAAGEAPKAKAPVSPP